MKPIQNRMTELLGVEYPIIQAPMGWIARAQLASAVSNSGGLGIIETSSGQLDEVRAEIIKMRELTDKPFGVNIAQAFVRDPGIVDFVVDQGIKFVTTSAGDPNKYCGPLKAAGLTVFHVVPTLAGALKAIDAGVDGLVVEGGEGGGFKNPKDVALMVLLPLIRSKVDVPIVAAGGIVCGRTMAAAFALGAPFAINVLADGQRDLAMHFARSGKDKFDVDAAWRMSPAPPRLHGARARLDCRVHALHAGGDHTIIVGEVLAVARSTASPLLFADGKFGRYTLDAGAPAVNHWSGLHGEWI